VRRNLLMLVVVLLFVETLGGCSLVKGLTFSKRKLETPNPTTYVFHVPAAQLRSALPQWGPDTPCPQAPTPCLILNRPTDGTNYDLVQLDRTKSDVYQWFGKPLDYTARYKLTVTPVSDSQTKIDVATWDSNVLIATGVGIHGGDYVEMVAPTTIEEYRFLLKIGEAIGEKEMPPLQLPQ
jgi:hypothetical protein